MLGNTISKIFPGVLGVVIVDGKLVGMVTGKPYVEGESPLQYHFQCYAPLHFPWVDQYVELLGPV